MFVVCLPPLTVAQQERTDTAGRDSDILDDLMQTTSRLGGHDYLLRYKFTKGQDLGYEVEHLVTVKTTIDGSSERQQSRSTSQKVWKVSDVGEAGEATFEHSIEYVNMWSESQGRQAVQYDSRKNESPPSEYEGVADTLGKTLTTVTVDERGEVLDREDSVKQIDLGTGGLLVPLPDKRVTVDDTWAVANDIPVRLEDGTFKAIKTRQRYRLEKVESGVATISLNTQILTPSITARVRSQLIQKLSNGTIKFDIDAGRIISKQLEWDETVVGFNGPKSNMEYLGRITETLVPAERMARAE
jgi:hypothetical protein